MDRRQFLAALAALPLAELVLAQERPRRFDLHHHFASPLWVKRFQASGRPGGADLLEKHSPARAIEELDKAGVSTAFLSCTLPGVAFTDDFASERADAIALARDMNDYGARLVSDHKGRFALFGVLPLPDVDASLREIEYVFDTLKADGVGILTSYQNIWLGDVRLQPVFDELNRRKAVVYVHPVDGPC